MSYKDNWDDAKRRYMEFWSLENHDRPVIWCTAPKAGVTPKAIAAPLSVRDRWLDTSYVIETHREYCRTTFFGGESYPLLWPNLGPDIMGAITGCELEFSETTSWARHFVDDWVETDPIRVLSDGEWYRRLLRMTSEMLDDADGEYVVGMTDLHPGLDGLVSMRGPENLCLDLADCPEAIVRATRQMYEAFREVVDTLFDMTSGRQDGSSNWTGIWHPGKWYVVSCDFMGMVSEGVFADFVLEEIEREVDFLDASIFHLDGPGALRHLDRLLEIPGLHGIQWVPGAGQPSVRHWIPVLRRIQDAGKAIQVYGPPEDLPALLDDLRPEGLMYLTSCRSEEESIQLIATAGSRRTRSLY